MEEGEKADGDGKAEEEAPPKAEGEAEDKAGDATAPEGTAGESEGTTGESESKATEDDTTTEEEEESSEDKTTEDADEGGADTTSDGDTDAAVGDDAAEGGARKTAEEGDAEVEASPSAEPTPEAPKEPVFKKVVHRFPLKFSLDASMLAVRPMNSTERAASRRKLNTPCSALTTSAAAVKPPRTPWRRTFTPPGTSCTQRKKTWPRCPPSRSAPS